MKGQKRTSAGSYFNQIAAPLRGDLAPLKPARRWPVRPGEERVRVSESVKVTEADAAQSQRGGKLELVPSQRDDPGHAGKQHGKEPPEKSEFIAVAIAEADVFEPSVDGLPEGRLAPLHLEAESPHSMHTNTPVVTARPGGRIPTIDDAGQIGQPAFEANPGSVERVELRRSSRAARPEVTKDASRQHLTGSKAAEPKLERSGSRSDPLAENTWSEVDSAEPGRSVEAGPRGGRQAAKEPMAINIGTIEVRVITPEPQRVPVMLPQPSPDPAHRQSSDRATHAAGGILARGFFSRFGLRQG